MWASPARRRSTLALVLFPFFVASCAHSTRDRAHKDAQNPQWIGRIAVRTQAADSNAAFPTQSAGQSWAASFDLQGSPGQGQLQLLSPLGTVVAQAQWRTEGAIWQADAQTHTAPTLQDLLVSQLKLPLPVDALFAWLDGQAAQAEGWVVDLSQHPNGRIQAQYSGPPTVDIRIILE